MIGGIKSRPAPRRWGQGSGGLGFGERRFCSPRPGAGRGRQELGGKSHLQGRPPGDAACGVNEPAPGMASPPRGRPKSRTAERLRASTHPGPVSRHPAEPLIARMPPAAMASRRPAQSPLSTCCPRSFPHCLSSMSPETEIEVTLWLLVPIIPLLSCVLSTLSTLGTSAQGFACSDLFPSPAFGGRPRMLLTP